MPEVRFAIARSDEELACLVAADDAGAFAELVDRHQRRIRTLCWRITGSLSDVDDLTQDTFLRAYAHRASYRPPRPFAAWLSRVCVNVCLTHKGRRVPACALAADDEPGAAIASDASDPEARAAGSDAVQRLVQSLAEPFRTTLVLRVFGGLSYDEIAEELGCAPGTVTSRITRARMHLKGFEC